MSVSSLCGAMALWMCSLPSLLNQLSISEPSHADLYEASLDELDLLVQPKRVITSEIMVCEYCSAPKPAIERLGPLLDIHGRRDYRYHSYTGRVMIIDAFNEPLNVIESKLAHAKSVLSRADVVGIDFEFGGDPREEVDKFIALVQIATFDLVVLLRTPRVTDPRSPWPGGLPLWVRELLISPRPIKAAVGFNGGDSKYLSASFGLNFHDNLNNHGVFELQDEIKRVVPHPLKKSSVPSFERLCRHFGYFPFKHGTEPSDVDSRAERQRRRAAELAKATLLVKVQTVWGSDYPLPLHKVRYAAEDAWFNQLVYAHLQADDYKTVALALMSGELAAPIPMREAELIPQRSLAEVEASAAARETYMQTKDVKICNYLISSYPVEGVSFSRQRSGVDLSICAFKFCLEEDSSICVVHSVPRAWIGKLHDTRLQAEANNELKIRLRDELCTQWLFMGAFSYVLPLLCQAMVQV